MAQTPEGKVKKKIREYLVEIGAHFFNPIGGAYSTAGVSDIIVCWRGRFVAIEVKAPGKVNAGTENQKQFITDVIAAGGEGFFADDVATVRARFEAMLDHFERMPGQPNKSVRVFA